MKLHSPINLVIGLIAIVFSGYCFSLDDEGHKMTQVGFGCLLFVIGLIFVKIAFRKPEEEKPVVAPPKPQPQAKAKEKPQRSEKVKPAPTTTEVPKPVVAESQPVAEQRPAAPRVEPQTKEEVVTVTPAAEAIAPTPLEFEEEETEVPAQTEPEIVEPQNNTEMKKKEEPKVSSFEMNLVEMMFMKNYGLTVIGQVTSGTIKVGDKVVISNGEKEIEDMVTGVNYNRAMHDSYTYDGSDMEIGLLLKSAVRKDLKGDITAYSVRLATAEPVEAPE